MEDTITRIIHSAIELFAEKGFHETKVDEIAEKSDVAKGTIYLYFKSKDEILTKSIQYIAEKAIENYKIDENLSFSENLRRIINRNIEFVKNNIPFYKVMFNNTYNISKENIKKARHNISSILSEISKLVQIGKKEGIVREDINNNSLSILITNLLFSSLMTIVITLIADELIKIPIDEFKEDIYKFILTGIRGRL